MKPGEPPVGALRRGVARRRGGGAPGGGARRRRHRRKGAVMRRDRLVWVISLVATLMIGAAPAHAQDPGPALAPCTDVPAELSAKCGSVTVALDRANPGLGTTQVAFAVLPRRDASRPSLGM